MLVQLRDDLGLGSLSHVHEVLWPLASKTYPACNHIDQLRKGGAGEVMEQEESKGFQGHGEA